jgi:vacuolar-type H+-ATPase subunit I/STV1
MTNRTFSVGNLTLSGGLGVLGGIWLIIAPFILDYSAVASTATTNANNATLMSIIVGVVAIVLSIFLVATEKIQSLHTLRLYAGIGLIFVGVWLMAAPFLFNYNSLAQPLMSMQIAGALYILVAGFVMQELYNRGFFGEKP